MTERKLSRAVITGCTGAIGSALSRILIERGAEVYAVVRKGCARTGNLPESDRLHIVECDISEQDKLPRLISGGADAFFHLAWTNTLGDGRNDMTAQNDNVRFALEAVRAAKELGCRVFAGAGSQAEYGRVKGAMAPDTPCFPESGYGIAKLCAGMMTRLECRKLGIDHIWLRVLSAYGEHDGEGSLLGHLIDSLLAGETPKMTAGEQLWDYLYEKDAGEAFYLAALRGKDGAVYPVGSGNAMALREYAEILRDCIDPSLAIGFGEIPYSPNQIMHLQADISALSADTGFAPRTEFREGIQRVIEQHRKKGSAK